MIMSANLKKKTKKKPIYENGNTYKGISSETFRGKLKRKYLSLVRQKVNVKRMKTYYQGHCEYLMLGRGEEIV